MGPLAIGYRVLTVAILMSTSKKSHALKFE